MTALLCSTCFARRRTSESGLAATLMALLIHGVCALVLVSTAVMLWNSAQAASDKAHYEAAAEQAKYQRHLYARDESATSLAELQAPLEFSTWTAFRGFGSSKFGRLCADSLWSCRNCRVMPYPRPDWAAISRQASASICVLDSAPAAIHLQQPVCRLTSADVFNSKLFYGSIYSSGTLRLHRADSALVLGIADNLFADGVVSVDTSTEHPTYLIAGGGIRINELSAPSGGKRMLLIQSTTGSVEIRNLDLSIVDFCHTANISSERQLGLRIEAAAGITINGSRLNDTAVGCPIPRSTALWPRYTFAAEYPPRLCDNGSS